MVEHVVVADVVEVKVMVGGGSVVLDNNDCERCKNSGQEAQWSLCNYNDHEGRSGGGWWTTMLVEDVKMVDNNGGGQLATDNDEGGSCS